MGFPAKGQPRRSKGMGKPSKGTPKDKRLSENKPKGKKGC